MSTWTPSTPDPAFMYDALAARALTALRTASGQARAALFASAARSYAAAKQIRDAQRAERRLKAQRNADRLRVAHRW